jgi:Domain of unknown function (DUF4412)
VQVKSSSETLVSKTASHLLVHFFALALLLLPATAASGATDLRLERRRLDQRFGEDAAEEKASRELLEVLFISARSARLDSGTTSAIVRVDDGVFLWIDHDAKAYAELTLPLRMEDLLTDEEQECVRHFPQALAIARASVIRTAEHRAIEGWETEKLRIEGQHPSGPQFEQDTWLTKDLPADLEPYHQLVRAQAALSLLWRGWIEQLIAAGGFPVESKATVRDRGSVRVSEKRLEKVEEVEFDASRYLPPAGYTPTLDRPPLDVACVRPPGLN